MEQVVEKVEMMNTDLGPLAVTQHGHDGPWVLLWHSLFVDGRSWDAVLPALTARHRVLVVDGPCHGRSPGPDRRFSLDDCAKAALAVLDHKGASQADWIGNAWGGHVGIALAATAPQRLRSVAAICSPMQALRTSERLKFLAMAAIFRLSGWTDALANKIAGVLILETANADARRYVLEAIRAPGAARSRRAMKSVMFGRPSLLDRLPRIEIPTLFVTTDGNLLWPQPIAEEHAHLVRNCRVVALEGSRHLPPLEIPDQMSTLLTSWLNA